MSQREELLRATFLADPTTWGGLNERERLELLNSPDPSDETRDNQAVDTAELMSLVNPADINAAHLKWPWAQMLLALPSIRVTQFTKQTFADVLSGATQTRLADAFVKTKTRAEVISDLFVDEPPRPAEVAEAGRGIP